MRLNTFVGLSTTFALSLPVTKMTVANKRWSLKGSDLRAFNQRFDELTDTLKKYKYKVKYRSRWKIAYLKRVAQFVVDYPDIDEDDLRKSVDRNSRFHLVALICLCIGFMLQAVATCLFFQSGPGPLGYSVFASGVVLFFIGFGFFMSVNYTAPP